MARSDEQPNGFVGALPIGTYEDEEVPELLELRRSRSHESGGAGRRRGREVVVTDFDMPFWSMVAFMVKASIAAIPALVILAVIGLFVGLVLGALGITFFGR